MVKNPPADAGDLRDEGLIPGSRRFPGGGNGNLLPYRCLKKSTDRGAWQATVCACCVLSRFSCVQLFVTLWTVTCLAPPSMGILQVRILEWVFPSPGALPGPEIEPTPPKSLASAGGFFAISTLGNPRLQSRGFQRVEMTECMCLHMHTHTHTHTHTHPISLPLTFQMSLSQNSVGCS